MAIYLDNNIISQYEFVFCTLAGLFAGVFKILDHNVEKCFLSILAKLISSMILGSVGFFIFDFKFMSERMRVGASFFLAYGGSKYLDKILDNITDGIVSFIKIKK